MEATTGTSAVDDALATPWLADWRRRVAELYAAVRARAAEDPELAWRQWVDTRERLYRSHPSSPVPPSERPVFRAAAWPYDPALRFEAVALELEPPPLTPAPTMAPITLPTSGPSVPPVRRLGTVTVPFADGPAALAVFWLEEYAGGLFLPFRDATNGAETYGAGRYLLDAAKSADLGGDPERGTLVLDFNFAYQPSCAFDPRWSCPLAPPENRLARPIRAGERIG
jgi:uncharacterized protein (DUF1684 family)